MECRCSVLLCDMWILLLCATFSIGVILNSWCCLDTTVCILYYTGLVACLTAAGGINVCRTSVHDKFPNRDDKVCGTVLYGITSHHSFCVRNNCFFFFLCEIKQRWNFMSTSKHKKKKISQIFSSATSDSLRTWRHSDLQALHTLTHSSGRCWQRRSPCMATITVRPDEMVH